MTESVQCHWPILGVSASKANVCPKIHNFVPTEQSGERETRHIWVWKIIKRKYQLPKQVCHFSYNSYFGTYYESFFTQNRPLASIPPHGGPTITEQRPIYDAQWISLTQNMSSIETTAPRMVAIIWGKPLGENNPIGRHRPAVTTRLIYVVTAFEIPAARLATAAHRATWPAVPGGLKRDAGTCRGRRVGIHDRRHHAGLTVTSGGTSRQPGAMTLSVNVFDPRQSHCVPSLVQTLPKRSVTRKSGAA